MPSPTQLMQVPTDGKRAPSRCMSLRITEVLFCLLRQMNWETLRESSPELLEQSSSATSSSPHPENGRIVLYVLQLHYVVVGVSWFGHRVRKETLLTFHPLIFPCCLHRIVHQPFLVKRWVVCFFFSSGISASPESITLSEPVAAPAPAIEVRLLAEKR